jgi:hypothetical protein
MNEKILHLSEDQLVLSVSDEGGLPEAVKDHLETCATCREKRSALQSELELLGAMAERFAPEPRMRPQVAPAKGGRLGLPLPAFAGGLAAFAVVAVLVSVLLLSKGSEEMRADLGSSHEPRLHLVEEILDDSVLSGPYGDMTPVSHGYLDDDFLDFVAPVEASSDSVQNLLSAWFHA